jgi:hypothetical protein
VFFVLCSLLFALCSLLFALYTLCSLLFALTTFALCSCKIGAGRQATVQSCTQRIHQVFFMLLSKTVLSLTENWRGFIIASYLQIRIGEALILSQM